MPLSEKPLGEHEFPSESDLLDGDDAPAEMRCPNCGGAVIEDTPKCPLCGDWITPRDAGSASWRRAWFVAVVLLMLYAMLRWVL